MPAPVYGGSGRPLTESPAPAAQRRSRLVGLAVLGGIAGAVTALTRWSGSGGSRGWGNVFVIAAPALGALGVVMTPIFWVRDRRRDFMGEPRRRPLYLGFLALSAWFLATLPLGHAVMLASAAESKDRAREVLKAAQAFRRETKHWPESMAVLESKIGRRLPRPTLGRDWVMWVEEDRLYLAFSSALFMATHTWQCDVAEERWTDYEQ